MSSQSIPELSLTSVRIFLRLLFESAKNRWIVSVVLRILTFVIGLTVVVFAEYARGAVWIVAAAAVAAEIAAYLAEKRKSVAEWLLRQLDLHEGFGQPLPIEEIADLRLTLPRVTSKSQAGETAVQPYFAAANDAHGSTRAVRQTHESAWWSKYLAAEMFRSYAVAFVMLLAFGFISLIVAIEMADQVAALDTTARVAIAVVVFAFSATVGRQALGYKGFRDGAEACERKARRLLERQDISVLEAAAMMSEYHVRRAAAPLIPSFIHERNRARLSAEWNARSANT